MKIKGPAHVTPDERDANEWAIQARRDRITHVRELAGQWGTTVGVIAGLLGAGTLIDSDKTIQALAAPYSAMYGLAAAIALLAAASSVLLASRASQGRAEVMPPDIDGIVALREDEFARSVRQLSQSRIGAGLAVVALVLAFGLRWYGPQAPSHGATWTATKTDSGYVIKSQ